MPHYIAYIFACLLIKLCEFSSCLTFLRNGLTLKEAGLISIEAGLISIDAGLISMEAGLISIEDGLISMEAGLISIDAGLISMEAGLISIEDGLISTESSGEHDVYFKFNDCNFYMKYQITSKARITAFVINVPGFVSSCPTILLIFLLVF